jgi:hypothetical protein
MRVLLTFACTLLVAACGRASAPEAPNAPAPEPAAVTGTSPEPTTHGSPCPDVATVDAEGQPLPQPQWLADSPVGVTAHFYEKVLVGTDAGGAPHREQLEAWRPHLTRALADALALAADERDAAAAAKPDEKPPYVEGSLFSSLFEGYTSAQPITVATEGERATVPVCFRYEGGDGQVSEWVDNVKLLREDGAWRIDDVAYGGQWDFANTGTLRGSLPKQ